MEKGWIFTLGSETRFQSNVRRHIRRHYVWKGATVHGLLMDRAKDYNDKLTFDDHIALYFYSLPDLMLFVADK